MATTRPFRGLRYSGAAGELSEIVAPPYDVISPEQREKLAAQSEFSVVGITLPEQEPDDRSKFVKYARSAARIEAWRREGVLVLEEKPSYYRYTQNFEVPRTGQKFTRTKLISTIQVEPYSNNVVLPHEQTFPKHKEDRLRILEATMTHVECIFGLFEDDDKSVHDLIASSPGEGVAELDVDGIHHVVDRISDPSACDAITNAMAEKKVWIADGHHRYETALAFRERKGEQDVLIAEDFMMMALCSISDPGLVLLPTHRILKKMPISLGLFRNRLDDDFEVSDTPNTELAQRIEGIKGAFGIALPGGKGLVAICKDPRVMLTQTEVEGGEDLKRLDVSILHSFIFTKLLGLTGHDFFGYTRSVKEAVEAVEHGAPAAFLMNPPSVGDMRTVANSGDFMPQKSTYYYPKLLSGLVLWSLKDFE